MASGLKGRRASRKKERLEARVTSGQKRLIERAAELRGTTVTEFIVLSAHRVATETIEESRVLHLRDEAQQVFVDAILNPPAPNDAARRAAQRYKQDAGF